MTQLYHLLAPLAAAPANDGRDREVGIVSGILVCLYCERWYPIRNGFPELLPDHLRYWEEDRAWLMARQAGLMDAGLRAVGQVLSAQTAPKAQDAEDSGAHHKRAEMAITQRSLPEGFFGPALTSPFNPGRPAFSLDLLARYVTTVSRLDCGVNGTVFDLGVGYAWTTEWLVRLGYQAIGLDICRDYMRIALPRFGSYLPHLLVGDIENLPLRDECVDAVLSFDAFHHVPNRPRAMLQIARIMRAGAKMVFVEPGKAHESHPQSVAVMQQHGILERGFDQADLAGYVQDTEVGNIMHHRSDVHPHDIFTTQKAGRFETDSLSPRALVAEMAVQPESASVSVGIAPEIVVTTINSGDTTWLNATPDGQGEVHLGANLFDKHHTLLKQDYARILLPRSVSPGQGLRLRCILPPVQVPGSYVVELDMVDNGFMWFKDFSYRMINWNLEVIGEHLASDEDHPIVSPAAPARITPTELPLRPDPVQIALTVAAPLIPDAPKPLLHRAWAILRLHGPVVFGGRAMAFLRRQLKSLSK